MKIDFRNHQSETANNRSVSKKMLSLQPQKFFEMLGRRQIREKVVETIYSNCQNPLKYDVLEKNMLTEIEKIYHLYIYQLNFLIALK